MIFLLFGKLREHLRGSESLAKPWPGSLRRESFELPEGRLDPAGALWHALDAPRTLLGCSGGLPETLRERPGRSRGALRNPLGRPRESLGPLFGAVSMEKVGSEAETVTCLKMMTLSMELLCF